MCGIAGIVRFDGKPIEPATLDAMQRAIRHRGPDGEGRYVTEQCALLHARLSIVDIAGGAQPMHLAADEKGGALTVVFNGEIYNHRELRMELTKLGHKFHSDHSDTEVLLHGYREWGIELVDRLRGMFAFGIWDVNAQRLVLARDRIGKKPLFFSQSDGKLAFRFASVPAALLAAQKEARADPDELYRQLGLGYPRASVVEGVGEVAAGGVTVVGATGANHSVYWRPFEKSRAQAQPHSVLMAIHSATEARLEADVPRGCFLSGGIDSALIAAVAQEVLKKRGGDALRTFTVAMPDHSYDESAVAGRVAEKLGTNHLTLRINPSTELFGDLEKLIAATGEPMADSSILPTYWICKAAREHVKVALSGDGGDEMFGGYDRYRAMQILRRHGWWLRWLPMGSVGAGADGRSTRARLRRISKAAQAPQAAAQYEQIVRLFQNEQLAALAPAIRPRRLIEFSSDESAVDASMTWDRMNYLPQDVLRKVDRASMLAGVEVRSPLLDREVMEQAVRCSSQHLMPQNEPKAILRGLVSSLVGPEIANLPKRGFGLPIGSWFATSLHDELRQRLLDGPLDRIGFVKPVIAAMLDEHKERRVDHTHRLFALLALSMWVDAFDVGRIG